MTKIERAKATLHPKENRFGSELYAAEELVAELGSAFLSAELQLETEPRTDNAPYIENLCVAEHKEAYVF
jgi:antirestriction protein ArdC